VNREVEEALAVKCPIIPFFATDFVRPGELPDSIVRALEYNGVTMDVQFPDATFDRLSNLLGPSQRVRKPMLVSAASALLIAALLWVASTRHGPRDAPEEDRLSSSAKVRPLALAGAWPNGSNIKIGFLNGSAAQKQKVEQVAKEWLRYANMPYTFSDTPTGDARIIFSDNNIASWSFRGTEARDVPPVPDTIRAIVLNDQIRPAVAVDVGLCSPTIRGLCHEASIRPVTQSNRSLATKSYRQLLGWDSHPPVICAVGAH
jgi:hypothetical protein